MLRVSYVYFLTMSDAAAAAPADATTKSNDASVSMKVAPPPECPPVDKHKKRFEIKKWNAVTLWAWGT